MPSVALFGAALHVEQVGLKKSKRYHGEYDIFERKLRQWKQLILKLLCNVRRESIVGSSQFIHTDNKLSIFKR